MIRRILLLVLIPLLAMSCEDTEVNNPALQIMINGELFRAKEMNTMKNEDGGYIIQGIEENRKLQIYLTDISSGSYMLGEGAANKIVYLDENGVEFTTMMEKASGGVMLTEDSGFEYVTGTFYFQTIDTTKIRIQAHNGHIYQVPFGSGEIDVPDLENKGDITVDEEEIPISKVEAEASGNSIKVEIIGSDQRISIVLPKDIQESVVALPSTVVEFNYYVDGTNQNIQVGELDIMLHEANVGMMMASFEFSTGENKVEGSFQIVY